MLDPSADVFGKIAEPRSRSRNSPAADQEQTRRDDSEEDDDVDEYVERFFGQLEKRRNASDVAPQEDTESASPAPLHRVPTRMPAANTLGGSTSVRRSASITLPASLARQISATAPQSRRRITRKPKYGQRCDVYGNKNLEDDVIAVRSSFDDRLRSLREQRIRKDHVFWNKSDGEPLGSNGDNGEEDDVIGVEDGAGGQGLDEARSGPAHRRCVSEGSVFNNFAAAVRAAMPVPAPHERSAFGGDSRADVNRCIETLLTGRLLELKDVVFVCSKLTEVLQSEPNVRQVPSPLTFAGDIHGQFYDLVELFRVGGHLPFTNYLFLGDYVDRGRFSLETISLLACLKVRYPDRITLIRGNHESRSLTRMYGFHKECMVRYRDDGPFVWRQFTDMFNALPLAALVDGTILAVHAGISPELHTLAELRELNRFCDVPNKGLMADLMWSDPSPDISGFAPSSRGAGFIFGADAFERFRRENNLEFVVRSHQLCQKGYEEMFDGRLLTVWSAPNYCNRMRNMASIMELNIDHSYYFNVFDSSTLRTYQGLQPPLSVTKSFSPARDRRNGNVLPAGNAAIGAARTNGNI